MLVGLGFALAIFFAEGGGSYLALQEVLARWASHGAESAPQPPGFAGVIRLSSTVLGAQHCGKDFGGSVSPQTSFARLGTSVFPSAILGTLVSPVLRCVGIKGKMGWKMVRLLRFQCISSF